MKKKPDRQSPNCLGHWRKKLLVLITFGLLSVRLLSAQQIISFNAWYQASSVYFTWELSDSTVYQELAIERSADQQLFSACLTLNSANSRLNAWDKTPLPGTSWYRLRLTAPNGLVIFSPVVMVFNPAKIKLDPVTWQNRLCLSDGHLSMNPAAKLLIFEINGNLHEIKNINQVNECSHSNLLSGFHSGKPMLLMLLDGDGRVGKKIITGIY